MPNDDSAYMTIGVGRYGVGGSQIDRLTRTPVTEGRAVLPGRKAMKRGREKGMLLLKNNIRKITTSRTSKKIKELDSLN